MNLILPVIILIPLIMAPIAYILGRKNNNLRMLVSAVIIISVFTLALIAFIQILSGKELSFTAGGICGMGIDLKLDGFRGIHAVLAAFMWLSTAAFNREYSKRVGDVEQARFTLFNLLTLSATIGVFLSSSLFTTFIFFEIMSFTSYMWVLHDESEKSMKAAQTYLGISVICGMIMLMGLFLLYNAVGTLDISLLYNACANSADKGIIYLSGALILVGFGAKAGMYPLHIWMPKTYPAAPAPASALLSGILSKAGIYGIIVISSSVFIYDSNFGMALLILGTITMFWGGILGLFSVDFKKIIACSSMSQIGFILVGIGMQGLLGEENSLAVRGTLLHMVNHSLLKLVLFTLTGVVSINLKKYHLNDIRGFGRGKPVFLIAFLSADLGIGGIPLFNGYVSKTLLHESIVEYSSALSNMGNSPVFITVIEWIFLISGGLTVAYMLKLFVCLFMEKGRGEGKKKYISKLSAVSLLVPSLLMPLIGFLPNLVADKIADIGQGIMHGATPETPVNYFSFLNIKGAFISITLGLLFYFIIVRRFMMSKSKNGIKLYIDKWPEHFDLETMLYRFLVETVIPGILGGISILIDKYIPEFFYKLGLCIIDAFSTLTSGVTDGLIAVSAKSVFKPLKEKEHQKLKNPIAYKTGKLMDKVTDTWGKDNNKSFSYADTMQDYEKKSALRRKMIAASLSYGLMFCGLGLVIVLLYLLLS